MWEHAAIQDNLKTLVDRGVIVVPAEEGKLAVGTLGRVV